MFFSLTARMRHRKTPNTHTHTQTHKFCSMRFFFVIRQVVVSIATKCWALTCCMNVSYIIGHELASSLLFQHIVSISSILWNVTPCSLVNIYKIFGRTCYFSLQGLNICQTSRK
jgi:hypothetical protein